MSKIDLSPPRRDTDDAARMTGLTELIDGYCDQTDSGYSINRRGGLWTFWNSGLDGGVDGVYFWAERKLLIMVCAGEIFAFSNTTDEPTQVSSASVKLNINVPVSFATNGYWLFMCNDSRMVAWDGTNNAIIRADEPLFSTVAFLAGSFVASLSDGSLAWVTETGYVNSATFPAWAGSVFLDDVDSPDALYAVGAGWNELMMFGPRSAGAWAPSGDSDLFTKIQGAPITRGILGKATILQFNNAWWWMDPERKLIRLEGRNPVPVSLPFDRPFRSMSVADDCRGFVIDNRFLCFTFPTADYTFVFDTYNGGWAKWAFFNPDTGLYERFLGQCAAFVPEWNLQFVGSRKNGQLLIYHQNLVTDQYNLIRTVARTSHIDWGTMKRKQSRKLLMRLKRGA